MYGAKGVVHGALSRAWNHTNDVAKRASYNLDLAAELLGAIGCSTCSVLIGRRQDLVTEGIKVPSKMKDFIDVACC